MFTLCPRKVGLKRWTVLYSRRAHSTTLLLQWKLTYEITVFESLEAIAVTVCLSDPLHTWPSICSEWLMREWDAGEEEVGGEGQATAKQKNRCRCRWVGQSGDGERRDSPKASGGWMENGNEGAWWIMNVAGEDGQRRTDNSCGSSDFLSAIVFFSSSECRSEQMSTQQKFNIHSLRKRQLLGNHMIVWFWATVLKAMKIKHLNS